MRISDWSSDVCSSDLQCRQQLRRVQQLGVDWGLDRAGRDVVDVDAERRKLDRQIAHHHFHAALARAITGEMRERQLLMDGTDVDDEVGKAPFRERVVTYV